ncbi:MAG: hypothetical protein K2P70_08460 [Hyphomonadaceae bacterium]|nr:hypothetical protein [Hyphomonadaceae bacterium]
MQFWHDLHQLPGDVHDCIASWTRWERSGFRHALFDQHAAKSFICRSLGERHVAAFERCYHPSMQADYFRLCYLHIEGGLYVDADDVCTTDDISWLMEDGSLKLQPLCYDTATESMVEPANFLPASSDQAGWIFYFNNNPLIAAPHHPVVGRALDRATRLLELARGDDLPEIQSTTGPGNLTQSIYELSRDGLDLGAELVVLREWDKVAISRWPLSYRDDARNWRHSNRKRFPF